MKNTNILFLNNKAENSYTLQNDFTIDVSEEVIRAFSGLAAVITSNILVTEISLLYFNKIYDKETLQNVAITMEIIAKDLDKIFNRYQQNLKNDLTKKLQKRISNIKLTLK
jgi:hypothetical protein